MPKRKPSQVITHRIELQETERAALEAALAGRFVTNGVGAVGSVFSGVGSVLAPFAGAFTALAALWIGDRTLDMIRDDGEKRKQEIEDSYVEGRTVYDIMICAWLNATYAEGGWDALCSTESRGDLIKGQFSMYLGQGGLGVRIPQWLFDAFLRFLDTICASPNARSSDKTPAELWIIWMPDELYGQSAYYADTEGSRWDALWKGIGTL